jgi:ATP-dependent exoDNAse (exonuclease V) beta subunit
MATMLNDLISVRTHQEYATASGRRTHAQMAHVFYTKDGWTGDAELIKQISGIPNMSEFFGPLSRTEVPIAGYVDGKFISRRVDRLYVDDMAHKVVVLDYKTDVNKNLFRKKYTEQLKEYYLLLKQIYKNYSIECNVLWLNDFTLENII